MKVIEPGHRYLVDGYDGGAAQEIEFFRRIGSKYPGNTSPHGGTNCQELLRVLIDRVHNLDYQRRSPFNQIILNCLRGALFAFELRAAHLYGLELRGTSTAIELYLACPVCGHLVCGGHQ